MLLLLMLVLLLLLLLRLVLVLVLVLVLPCFVRCRRFRWWCFVVELRRRLPVRRKLLRVWSVVRNNVAGQSCSNADCRQTSFLGLR